MKRTGQSLPSCEPRVLVTGWKNGRWSAAGKTVDEALCSGVQSWVYAFDGDYIGHRELARQDLDRYDIVIANTNKPLLPLVRLAQDRPAALKWVSLIEGNAEDYCVPQDHLKPLLESSDLINVINRHSLPLFTMLTTSKVKHIGMPYPVEGVRKLMTPFERRTRRIFLCTPLLRGWNDYLAARQFGMACYGHETSTSSGGIRSALSRFVRTGVIAANSDGDIARARELYSDDSLEIIRFTKNLKQYFCECGNSHLWMNLESRATWGRYVLDAAALCLPIITTTATGHGDDFFPLSTVAHFMDIDRAIEIGKQLIRDRDFYLQVASVPAEKMDFLKSEPMKQALLAALGGF